MRTCDSPRCTQPFTPKVPNQRFCSRKCQDHISNARSYQRRRIAERPCDDCGELTPVKRGRRLICPDCRGVPTWPPATRRPADHRRICCTCARLFESPASSAAYCSLACRCAALSRLERKCPCGMFFRPTGRPYGKTATECWMCRSANFVEGGASWKGVAGFRRQLLLRREDGRCQDCGTTAGPLHAHHVVPRALGGTHDLDNLRLLCEDCHVGSGWARNHATLIEAGLAVAPAGMQLVLVV